MRKILVLLLIIFLAFNMVLVSAEDIQSQLFREAKKLTINRYSSGRFSQNYEIDTYIFSADEAGFYAFRGKADTQIRGHLYNENYQFLYGGDNFSNRDSFFLSVYLEARQTVYIRVDSKARVEQGYSIVVAKDSLPFNRIVLSRSSITKYVDASRVETLVIPLSFYMGSQRISAVETTYPYMMQVSANGSFIGQAAYNLLTNDLEIDVRGTSDAKITLNIGPYISTSINVKTLDIIDKPSDSDDGVDNDGDTSSGNDTESPGEDTSSPLPEETERKPQIHPGDVNLNNVVDMNDVVALLDPVSLSRFSQQQFLIADVTNNEIVDANDALMILRRVSGARR